MSHLEIWLKGLLAAAITGAANGIITGFAAVGIDPSHFNLAAGFGNTISIASVSAGMSGIIAVAAYLKQSPLPDDSTPPAPASGGRNADVQRPDAPNINTDPYPSMPAHDAGHRDDHRP
jgi:hypothetical protein